MNSLDSVSPLLPGMDVVLCPDTERDLMNGLADSLVLFFESGGSASEVRLENIDMGAFGGLIRERDPAAYFRMTAAGWF